MDLFNYSRRKSSEVHILAEADQETPGLLYAPIDLADTTAEDDYLNYLRHRHPELYHPALRD